MRAWSPCSRMLFMFQDVMCLCSVATFYGFVYYILPPYGDIGNKTLIFDFK
ncbi:hypothetical protein Hdeb2414_s0051g00751861 [Helianthus debilis subsp. tardiflorus]